MTDWLTDWQIDWTWNNCQLVPLEQPQGLVMAVPVSQHSFHREDLVDPSLSQNYPPVLFQTTTTIRNEDLMLGENHPSDGCSSQSPLFSPRIKTGENYPPVLFQIITAMRNEDSVLTLSTKSLWYDCNGWLGVKHQVTYLLSTKNKDPNADAVELPTCFVSVNHNSFCKNQGPNPSEKSAW